LKPYLRKAFYFCSRLYIPIRLHLRRTLVRLYRYSVIQPPIHKGSQGLPGITLRPCLLLHFFGAGRFEAVAF